LVRGNAGQHLIDMLTTSGIAGLAAGTAGSGTAHQVSPFRGGDGGTRLSDNGKTPSGYLIPRGVSR
jgi:hypothetical protein